MGAKTTAPVDFGGVESKTLLMPSLPGHLAQRQLRRAGQLDAAYDAAELHVAAAPQDRRGWARLAHVAFLVHKPVAADRALAKLVELAVAASRKRDAVRALLRRASLFANVGGKPGPLAEQALELAAQSGDAVGVFLARRVLSVLAVREGNPAAAVSALTDFLRAALDTHREVAALTAVSQLAVGSGPGAGAAAKLLGLRAAAHLEREVAMRWFQEAQRRLPGDLEVETEMEKLTLANGMWRELASIYQVRAARESGPAKVATLEQLAELFEDELSNPQGALEAYEQALAVDAASGPLREIFRLSALLGNLGYAVEQWKRMAPGKVVEGAAVLEHVAQTDLPASARVRLFETLAAVARDDLGDAARAQAALVKAESLRSAK